MRAGRYLDKMNKGPMARLLGEYSPVDGRRQARDDDVQATIAIAPHCGVYADQRVAGGACAGICRRSIDEAYETGARAGGVGYFFFVKNVTIASAKAIHYGARKLYQDYHDTHLTHPHILAGLARLETGAPAPELPRAVNAQMAYGFAWLVMERESRLELALAPPIWRCFWSPTAISPCS